MPQSLSSIIIHLICSTKDRYPWLQLGMTETEQQRIAAMKSTPASLKTQRIQESLETPIPNLFSFFPPLRLRVRQQKSLQKREK
jgi:hypothetical protein